MNKRFMSIAAVTSLCALAAAGCGGSDESSAGTESNGSGSANHAGKVLRVGMYGGTWTEAVKETAAKEFEKATGAKVEYVEGNPADIAANIYATAAQQADPPVDVIETDTQTQAQLAERKLLVPASEYESKVEGVFGEVSAPAANEGYAPAHCNWYIVYAYNKDKYKELGLEAPKSWSDLFNPKLAGHVSIPDVSTAMGIPTVWAAGEGDLKKGITELAKLKTYSVYSSSSDMQADFANGNIWAASAADGRAWQLVDDKQPVDVVYPTLPDGKVGPLAGSCFLDVVKGSKNVELAAEFIKASYSDRVQVDFAKLTGYTPSSESAVETLKDEEPVWEDRIPDSAKAAELDWKAIVPQIQGVLDQFNREIGR